jgi:TolA-binding protein
VLVSYALRQSGAFTGGCTKGCVARTHPVRLVRGIVVLALVLSATSSWSLGAETTPSASQTGQTNPPEATRAFLGLQEQLHATQLAIEQTRQETRAASAQTAAALSNALQTMQRAFSVQRAQDLEALKRSNRSILMAGGTVAAMGLLTMLVLTYFQWRMSRGIADVSAALPAALGLGESSAPGALHIAEPSNVPRLGAAAYPERPPYQRAQEYASHTRHRRGIGRSIERRLFPKPGDSFRRRQFRALKVAVAFGVFSALVVAVVIYLVYSQHLAS